MSILFTLKYLVRKKQRHEYVLFRPIDLSKINKYSLIYSSIHSSAFKGFDTHSDIEEHLNNLFVGINGAIEAFANEMKAMDIWNNVTLIQTSDFARTLNPNGGDGTDHAWGGNYMMMGKSFFFFDMMKTVTVFFFQMVVYSFSNQ